MKLKTIYKKAVSGKVLEWTIEVEANKYRTISGYVDGIKIEAEWTVCYPKNIGKKNATTAEEQALVEATAMRRKRLELGSFEDINDVDKPTPFKPMLAHKYEDYKTKLKYPVNVQPKLDGIRCIVKSDGMWTRNGKQIISAPHIFESLKHHFLANPDLILDGELYYRDRNNFNTICSLVKKTKPTSQDLEESKKLIQYWIYDVPSRLGRFDVRKVELYKYFHDEYIVMVETHLAQSEADMLSKYSEYIEQGYEGLMIRTLSGDYENKRSKTLLKYKTFEDDEFEILDVYEGQGRLTGMVGQMLFKTKKGDMFFSTVNGTQEYLTELWSQKQELIGKKATVKYFELTADRIDENGKIIKGGIPRFPKVINIDRFDI
jgi:DNA ligase-1